MVMDGITTVFLDIDNTLWWFERNSEKALATTFRMMGCGEWCHDYEMFHDHYERFNHDLLNGWTSGKLRI